MTRAAGAGGPSKAPNFFSQPFSLLSTLSLHIIFYSFAKCTSHPCRSDIIIGDGSANKWFWITRQIHPWRFGSPSAASFVHPGSHFGLLLAFFLFLGRFLVLVLFCFRTLGLVFVGPRCLKLRFVSPVGAWAAEMVARVETVARAERIRHARLRED